MPSATGEMTVYPKFTTWGYFKYITSGKLCRSPWGKHLTPILQMRMLRLSEVTGYLAITAGFEPRTVWLQCHADGRQVSDSGRERFRSAGQGSCSHPIGLPYGALPFFHSPWFFWKFISLGQHIPSSKVICFGKMWVKTARYFLLSKEWKNTCHSVVFLTAPLRSNTQTCT